LNSFSLLEYLNRVNIYYITKEHYITRMTQYWYDTVLINYLTKKLFKINNKNTLSFQNGNHFKYYTPIFDYKIIDKLLKNFNLFIRVYLSLVRRVIIIIQNWLNQELSQNFSKFIVFTKIDRTRVLYTQNSLVRIDNIGVTQLSKILRHKTGVVRRGLHFMKSPLTFQRRIWI